MSDLVFASTPADAEAVEEVRRHHAVMAGELARRVDYLLAAAARRDAFGGGLARMELLDWCRRELLPHARAEEAALYPAARETTQGRLLVEALLGEHAVIGRLPHDPLPLLDQVNQRWPSAFSVDYRERGPQAWRLRLVRTGC